MVGDFKGHVISLCDKTVQFILISLLMVKVHYSISAIIPVDLFSMVDTFDCVEILQLYVFDRLCFYSPVVLFDLFINVTTQLGPLAVFVDLEQPAHF